MILALLTIGTLAAVPLESLAAQEAEGLSLSVTPSAFSPDGNGRKDSTTILIKTGGPGQVIVRILEGEVERRRWEEGSLGGELSLEWAGKADGGEPLPDGGYTVEATFTDPLGPTSATEPVRIDTRPPSVSWESIGPSPASGRKPLRFAVRTSDAGSTETISIKISDPLGAIAEHRETVSTGSRVIRWRPRSGGRSLYPGTYRARFVAEDEAGNRRRSRSTSFRIERRVHGRVFRRLSGTGRKVAITIDDCHYRDAWSSMLRTLRRARAKATFFCPGDRMLMFPDLVRKTVRQGHTMASHGWDHAAMAGRGVRSAVRKLKRDRTTAWRLARATTAPYFRPPYGSYDGAVVRAAGITGHGRVIMWDVTTGDTSGAGTGAIVRNAVGGARKGSIILMHTIGRTAQALPAIIRGLKAKGLRPVGLPKLFRAAGYR